MFTFVVTAAQTGAAHPADGVDFVDENDGRRVFFGFFEHVPHAGSTHADKHLDEFGAADAVKRHIGFPGGGLGHQCFADARRTDQQYSLGQFAAQFLKSGGVPQVGHDFVQLFFGVVQSGHVVIANLAAFFVEQPGLGFGEAENTSAAPPVMRCCIFLLA